VVARVVAFFEAEKNVLELVHARVVRAASVIGGTSDEEWTSRCPFWMKKSRNLRRFVSR